MKNIETAIQQYYRENGLQQPQRITAELQASRILRAVYSERQLQEVMVDFWTNHFNVFAGKGADRGYCRRTIVTHPSERNGKILDVAGSNCEKSCNAFLSRQLPERHAQPAKESRAGQTATESLP
jgi:hypothetical protein